MKPDPDYLRRLLNALQASPSPWPSTAEIEKSGIEPDGQLLFHLQLLDDGGFVEPVDADSNFGFQDHHGNFLCQDISLRLTAQGHEFTEALDKQEVWEVIKNQFQGASIKTLFQVGSALVDGYARETIKKYTGNPKIKLGAPANDRKVGRS